jgi:glycosyltransferase involved in cell wall biosynthesis
MISKALIAGTSQRKLEEMAKLPDMELTVVTPPHWQHDDGSKQILEKLYTTGYEMIVTPMVLNGNYHLHFYPQLHKIMENTRPDIVYIDEEPYNFATFQAMRLARKYNASALFFAFQNLYREYPPPFRQFELYNYRHAGTAIAGNQDVVDVLRKKGYKGSISVIRQFGIDPDIYRRTQPKVMRQPGEPFVIGFFGRLVEQKGVTTLIDALAMLPAYCSIRFIGNGPMKTPLEAQAGRLGIADRITFIQGLPTYEIPKAMQEIDVFVLPSLTKPNWAEQFGRVLIESMACETPVIGSSSGEIPRVICDAGLIFAEGDANALAEQIRLLIEQPKLAIELGKKGRQRVLEKYTQVQIARETYEACLTILKKDVLNV